LDSQLILPLQPRGSLFSRRFVGPGSFFRQYALPVGLDNYWIGIFDTGKVGLGKGIECDTTKSKASKESEEGEPSGKAVWKWFVRRRGLSCPVEHGGEAKGGLSQK
jgi:hypothetical protein